ncbi:gluconeogenesis factor YvcK family protein [Thermosediminibacter litoriperuensis]|uniref:Putative gluconeogenesis factor n=1 Tax=Thermosediminibacter litoriperuensis TaxID=291989 RepID=A0A5S5AVZ9_9FIRM|nr:gluconeogenesis factor YvcK family protein [Thermosediminibacter litoriperuensis]TYP56707.1 putative cofD-like protein [Thermosediminibacter litoriperuensis]
MNPKIVAIGGGTGLPNLLRGLKHYTRDITAIVTVADDGGSSGILRDELKILPPGDIRNCLLALANTEPLMEKLFQYRFNAGSLKGHSFGNLFLAAMTDILGDFELAIKESSKVLAVSGQVLPSTLCDVILVAEYEDGTIVKGESRIPGAGRRIKRIGIIPEDARPLPEAVEAIEKADAIILGPGSLYTSILPNLLIKNLAGAVKASRARKIFIVNVMTQPGETDGYTAYDHVKTILEHAGDNLIDCVVINVEKIPEHLLLKYLSDGAHPVVCDGEKIKKLGYNVILGELLSHTDVIRHDPIKLAKVIMDIIK